MAGFERDAQGVATLSGTTLTALLQQAGVSTPAYVYDLDAISEGAKELVSALPAPNVVAYAVKANSAGTVVRALAAAGVGADVVSGAELELALGAGIAPERVVMSGVAKSDREIDLALRSSILAIQVESVEELVRIAARAGAAGVRARVTLRINPNVLIDSHAHIATGHDAAKFGIQLPDVPKAFATIDGANDALELVGISTHIGSMMTATDAYLEAGRVVCRLANERIAGGRPLRYVNFGGGFGIDYGAGRAPAPREFARAALALKAEAGLGELPLVVEPGRSLVGAHGVLVASVLQGKVTDKRRWLMIDAGMNDLLRPALYSAHHRIEPVERAPGREAWRVVGPVCESSDDFGEHPIGDALPERVVIRDAGAYGFVMASEYNGRSLPSEVFASGGRVVKVSPSPGARAWLERRLGA